MLARQFGFLHAKFVFETRIHNDALFDAVAGIMGSFDMLLVYRHKRKTGDALMQRA